MTAHMRARGGNEPARPAPPFTAGVTAVTLADRPWDCPCPWTLVPHGQPGGYSYGPESVLKYAGRWCRAHGHLAAGGS